MANILANTDRPEMTPISKIDPGELYIEVAKNAEHIIPEMQRAMADFMGLWQAPVMVLPTPPVKSRVTLKDRLIP